MNKGLGRQGRTRFRELLVSSWYYSYKSRRQEALSKTSDKRCRPLPRLSGLEKSKVGQRSRRLMLADPLMAGKDKECIGRARAFRSRQRSVSPG